MEQIRGLMRDTWKFWVAFWLVGIVGGLWVDRVIFLCLPLSLITIVYFAFVRYDKKGQRRS
jgi:hypothetical protein